MMISSKTTPVLTTILLVTPTITQTIHMSLPHLGVAVVTSWAWLAAVVLGHRGGGDRAEGEITPVGLNNTGTCSDNINHLYAT